MVMDIETLLRQALKNDGRTVYRISVDSGVPPASIYRFISGERSLKLKQAGMLANAVGLELRPKEKVKHASD